MHNLLLCCGINSHWFFTDFSLNWYAGKQSNECKQSCEYIKMWFAKKKRIRMRWMECVRVASELPLCAKLIFSYSTKLTKMKWVSESSERCCLGKLIAIRIDKRIQNSAFTDESKWRIYMWNERYAYRDFIALFPLAIHHTRHYGPESCIRWATTNAHNSFNLADERRVKGNLYNYTYFMHLPFYSRLLCEQCVRVCVCVSSVRHDSYIHTRCKYTVVQLTKYLCQSQWMNMYWHQWIQSVWM